MNNAQRDGVRKTGIRRQLRYPSLVVGCDELKSSDVFPMVELSIPPLNRSSFQSQWEHVNRFLIAITIPLPPASAG